jgi:hypothetical protein
MIINKNPKALLKIEAFKNQKPYPIKIERKLKLHKAIYTSKGE